LREIHPAGGLQPCKSRVNRVGMISVDTAGFVMKLRDILCELPQDCLRLDAFCFFFGQAFFFSFYLTGDGVFYNHHRSSAG
jgi:hypothetical protein